MRILLDTHVLIWHVEDDARLLNKYSTEIDDPANQVFVSIARLWEIAIKIGIGKLKLSLDFSDLSDHLDASTIVSLPVETRHLNVLAKLPFHHRDPFDRLLIAQGLGRRFDPCIRRRALRGIRTYALMISLSRASSDDAACLTHLAFDTFWDAFAGHSKNAPHDLDDYIRRAFTIEQVASELADPKAVFTIAEIDGAMAGYSKLILDTIEPGITAARPIELSRLYSQQRYLGKGVGQALMDRCFDDASQLNRDVMWLGVWEYNPRAQAFYRKQGFREVGKHVFQLGADPQTDLLMQKEL